LEFDQYCKKNDIIAFCIPLYLFYLLQLLDISIFLLLKQAYQQAIDTNIYLGINYINKQEFLQIYLLAWADVFTTSNIYRAFQGTELVLLDPAIVLVYLKVELQLSIPKNSTSKPFVLQTLQNILQLQYYTAVVLELLYKGLYSYRSTEQLIIEQLYKSAEIAIHSAVLIASTN
jgi:hypothetical protein